MALYNKKNPAVKRLMREAAEIKDSTDQYHAQPLEDNLFEWHFTIRGPPSSEFEGGIFHGRITLPAEYPMKPPTIILLTPNGRFEVNKKICLSISGHHPETWIPSWSIRTALLAIIGFFPTHGNGAIGSLDYSAEERKVLAKKSQSWKCDQCGEIKDLLLQENVYVSELNPTPSVNEMQTSGLNAHPINVMQQEDSNESDGNGHQDVSSVKNVESRKSTSNVSTNTDTAYFEDAEGSSTDAMSETQRFGIVQRKSDAVVSSKEKIVDSNNELPHENNQHNLFRAFSFFFMWIVGVLLALLILRRIFGM